MHDPANAPHGQRCDCHPKQGRQKPAAGDLLPVQRDQHGHGRHRGNHVARRALAWQAEHDQPYTQPCQQHPHRAGQWLETRPGTGLGNVSRTKPLDGAARQRRPPQAGDSEHDKGQQARVFDIGQHHGPQAGTAAMEGFMPVAAFVHHLAGILANDKFAPNGARIRIKQKPQREQAQPHQHADADKAGGSNQQAPAQRGC